VFCGVFLVFSRAVTIGSGMLPFCAQF